MSRSIIAVIGMHRSGTSLTMQALGALGAEAGGGLLAGDDYNRKGYWEAGEIVAFHDRLLAANGRAWGMPEHLLPLPEDWWGSDAAGAAGAELREILVARLEGTSQGSALALKDPRMTLFLPLWIRAAADLGVPMKALLCLRDPAGVSASLGRRDQTSQEMSEALWLAYTLAALANAADLPMQISRLDDWHDDAAGSLARIAQFTGLSVQGVEPPFAPELTSGAGDTAPSDTLVAELWRELRGFPKGSHPDAGLIARASLLRRGAAHLSILASEIRAEIGETPSHQLQRDLEAFRQGVERVSAERDAQVEKARELQSAYRSEAEARDTYETAFRKASEERALFEARAQEMHRAYLQEADARSQFEARARSMAEAYRKETEARQQFQDQAARMSDAYRKVSTEYEAFRRRLNPLKWFGRR
ncbi:hypothetical protein RGQ15_16335 [Paracoccus sp. MBLB3053]|uniref:Sulfotransferase family protein n=1 Tax=Paracoccus aurantius TaxID=3073814 RepID=A0ABU2HWZ8_9RHOB|nr:hypothetical protein [Paracoccus sp. MBLB3053]MDS9469134.1 hypothetical protein [Paracoccus sp. MBLB3053]